MVSCNIVDQGAGKPRRIEMRIDGNLEHVTDEISTLIAYLALEYSDIEKELLIRLIESKYRFLMENKQKLQNGTSVSMADISQFLEDNRDV